MNASYIALYRCSTLPTFN